MISVKYVAPLKRTEGRPDHTCHLDPYTMLSPRQGSMPYVVEVEHDWQEAGIQEGDLLVVDENIYPNSGDICVFVFEDYLSIRFVRKVGDALLPINHKKEEDLCRVIVGGTVTRLLRSFK